MKKKLIVSANSYALGGILTVLKNHFSKKKVDLYFLSNNFFKSSDDFIQSLKKINENNLDNFFFFNNFENYSYEKLKIFEIKKNIDDVIKVFEEKKLNFDEIIFTDFLSSEMKYLISKITKKNTIVSFIDIHFLDYDLIYYYLTKTKKLKIKNISFKYFLQRIKYEINFINIMREYLNNLMEFFVFGFISVKRSSKSYFRPHHLIHTKKLPIKMLNKIYFLFSGYKEIYEKTYNIKNLEKEDLSVTECKCEEKYNNKTDGLILVPFFSERFNNNFKEYLNYVEKKVIFFQSIYDLKNIHIKPHPRDKSNSPEQIRSILNNKFSNLNFYISNEFLFEKDFFCKFQFIFGVSSLIKTSTRYCQKIIPYSSYELFKKDRNIDKSIFEETYLEKVNSSLANKVQFLD